MHLLYKCSTTIIKFEKVNHSKRAIILIMSLMYGNSIKTLYKNEEMTLNKETLPV